MSGPNEEDGKEYRWETGYEKTWEAVTEDADGAIDISIQEILQRAKRKRILEKCGSRIKLGMMRHLYVILDLSDAMKSQDLKPTRLICSVKLLENFLEEFFHLNPISQVGLITTRNKRAELVSELAGNPKKHIERLEKIHNAALNESSSASHGEPSLQNSLELAMQNLKHMPAYASKELVVIMGSLTTCDPGDINVTMAACKTMNIRCSVISLGAEVRIYRELARVTGGDFNVTLDDCHLQDLLHAQLEPMPSTTSSEPNLIKMGFPGGRSSEVDDSTCRNSSGLGYCMCHLDTASGPKLTTTGYLCPQCQAKYCELPAECKSCGLTLLSAPHLARSYHHLFPLPAFNELPFESLSGSLTCFSCIRVLTSSKEDPRVYQCPDCEKTFCSDCDIFFHETLHSCPGCAAIPKSHINGFSGTNGNPDSRHKTS